MYLDRADMLCPTADGRLVRRLDYHSGKWNR
jgi:hypothetical protein